MATEQKSDDAPVSDNEERSTISFVDQVESALQSAKSSGKMLIVLCEEASTLRGDVWNHERVVERVRGDAVCMLLREGSLAFNQFTTLYPAPTLPTMYCIDPQNGRVLQCKCGEQITVDAVVQCIAFSADLMRQQQSIRHQLASQSQAPSSARSKLEQIRSAFVFIFFYFVQSPKFVNVRNCEYVAFHRREKAKAQKLKHSSSALTADNVVSAAANISAASLPLKSASDGPRRRNKVQRDQQSENRSPRTPKRHATTETVC